MDQQSSLVNDSLPRNTLDFIKKFKSEIESADFKALNNICNKLKFLCFEIDPFTLQPEDLGQEAKQILEEFNLTNSLDNPFVFTNILLQLMTTSEEELMKRKH